MWPGQFTGTFLKIHCFPAADKWYEHEPERVVKSDKAKLLWDYSIQTDYEIQNRTQDNFFLDKEEIQGFIVDIAVPGNYQDLKREITRLWNTKAYVVPVVVGALGMIPEKF